MRELDSLGLKLAEFQGKIFEESVTRYDCSSAIFLRRFRYSDYAMKLDLASPNTLLDIEYAFDELDKEYESSSYGKEKYSKEAMFWLGYIYRYICYTRDASTKKVFSLIDAKELIGNYYVYHTQSEEWVIARILELKGKDESFLDKNANLKRIMLERYKNDQNLNA